VDLGWTSWTGAARLHPSRSRVDPRTSRLDPSTSRPDPRGDQGETCMDQGETCTDQREARTDQCETCMDYRETLASRLDARAGPSKRSLLFAESPRPWRKSSLRFPRVDAPKTQGSGLSRNEGRRSGHSVRRCTGSSVRRPPATDAFPVAPQVSPVRGRLPWPWPWPCSDSASRFTSWNPL
jgi:hypothetical protein